MIIFELVSCKTVDHNYSVCSLLHQYLYMFTRSPWLIMIIILVLLTPQLIMHVSYISHIHFLQKAVAVYDNSRLKNTIAHDYHSYFTMSLLQRISSRKKRFTFVLLQEKHKDRIQFLTPRWRTQKKDL